MIASKNWSLNATAAALKKFGGGLTGQSTTSTPWKFDLVSRKIRRRRGLGLGHVTPTIFGSTVGYPSDSDMHCTKQGPANRVITLGTQYLKQVMQQLTT